MIQALHAWRLTAQHLRDSKSMDLEAWLSDVNSLPSEAPLPADLLLSLTQLGIDWDGKRHAFEVVSRFLVAVWPNLKAPKTCG